MSMIRNFLIAALLATPVYGVEMGDDGLHKATWMRETFKDLREDLAEANGEGKRLAIIIEQRGCIYCNKMHEQVFPVPAIDAFIRDNYFIVQLNMFGDVEVTDFDGEVLSEKKMIQKWGMLFTPTMMFFPEQVAIDLPAPRAAAAIMPGAFGQHTTLHMLEWVVQQGYDGDESFQKYHARRLTEDGLN